MKFFFTFLLLIIVGQLYAQKEIYKTPGKPIEMRVKDLLNRMTLDEKILQLNQYTFGTNSNVNNIGAAMKDIPSGSGSLIYYGTDPVLRNTLQKKAMEETRLGIPILFGYDVIHGFRTIYPISLAQACSWNPAMVSSACSMAAKETRLSGVDWTFSPMIDVARDARWGRVAEGYGEDPYTNAVFGVASVKGYQGNRLSDSFSIAACLKHYVGYGASEGGRDYHYTDVSMQTLWETYLPPYKACVEAGAATLMSGFNDITGTPATANHYTLTEVLKKRWNHDGFVVSDWAAIAQLTNQGVAADKKEAGLKAFTSGVEMDMKDDVYREYLPQLLAEKKITNARINDAVSRVLRIKFRLGLFDNPYTPETPEEQRYLSLQNRKVAHDLAAESIVLLKNKNSVLPVNANVKKVAIIGPMAKSKINLLGAWASHGKEGDVKSLYDGLAERYAGKVEITYAKGCDFDSTNENGFAEAEKMANDADMIIICLGEKKEWSGENASRSTLSLPRVQEKLVEHLKRTGKPIVLLLSNGRPLELVRLEPIVDAIVEIWQPGVEGGNAVASILSGDINPSGKLAITFPLTTGQIPVYYNMRQSARPKQGKYQDITAEPLYWFGYGLSYTTFNYDTVRLSKTKIKIGEKLTATVEVSNVGRADGKETLFWYISHKSSTISRPMKELVFFEKKEIKQGSTVTYQFELDPAKHLSYPDADGRNNLEPGDYFLIVNAQRIPFQFIPK